MPYRDRSDSRWERAGRTAHSRAVLTAIAEKKDFYVPAERIEPLDWLDDRTHPRSGLGELAPVDKVLAIDGSKANVEARAGMPSVRYGFVQASAVLLDLELYEQERVSPFVDPVQLRRAQTTALVSLDLPTAGAYVSEGLDIRTSWRESIYALFSEKAVRVADGRQLTLLDLLFLLEGHPREAVRQEAVSESVAVARCPGQCGCEDVEVGRAGGQCPCARCETTLYPTDVLRIAEEVAEQTDNDTSLSRLMQVVELLCLIGLLTLFWRHGRKYLSEIVFVMDGPLAMFGPSAKLKTRALDYVQALAAELEGPGPFVVGIEKSGDFVDFARSLARHAHLEPGTLVTVDEEVIRRIKNTDDLGDFGRDTYWGRKFYYYAADRRMLVLTLPPTSGMPYDRDGGQRDLGSYPSLPTVVRVIDKTGSIMYRDAVVPVALAHSAAAYPIGVGTDVLRLVARKKLRLAETAKTTGT